MHIPKIALLMLASLATVLCAMDAAHAQGVADDFKVIAKFGPGYSNRWPWKCTIGSDGKVLQEMSTPLKKAGEPYSKEFALSKDDLKFLVDKINEAAFFKLKNEYRPKVFDLQTLTLEITLNKQSHRVLVFGHQAIKDQKEQEEADRFLSVWKAILTKVPSPNEDNLEQLKAGIFVKERKKEPASPRLIRSIDADLNVAFRSMALSLDGKTVAALTMKDGVKLWNVKPGQIVGGFGDKLRLGQAIALAPQGKSVAVGLADGTVKLFDTATRAETTLVSGNTKAINVVAFSPQGQLLACAGETTIFIWNVTTERIVRQLAGHAAGVTSISFSPDGKMLASGADDAALKLWDVSTGNNVARLDAGVVNYARPLPLAFSPDGKLLAYANAGPGEISGGRKIKIWDLAAKKTLLEIKGHDDSIRSLVFSPDGQTIASSSWDNTIKLWSALSGAVHLELKQTNCTIAGFTPLGDRLIVQSGRSLHVWDVRRK